MECDKPNLSKSSCSDVRQQDEMLVTVSFALNWGKDSVPRKFLEFSGVGLDNFGFCLMNISVYRFLKNNAAKKLMLLRTSWIWVDSLSRARSSRSFRDRTFQEMFPDADYILSDNAR